MVTENLTEETGLIIEVDEDFLAQHPVVREDHEIVLLERVEDAGTRFHRALKPGEIISLTGKRLSTYVCLSVDMRQRTLPISGVFALADGWNAVNILAQIRYTVTDAAAITTATSDPLGRLRDIVFAELEGVFNDLSEVKKETFEAVKTRIISLDETHSLGIRIDWVDITGFATAGPFYQQTVTVDSFLGSIDLSMQPESLESRFDRLLQHRLLRKWPDGKLNILSSDTQEIQKGIASEMRDAVNRGVEVTPDSIADTIVKNIERFSKFRLDAAVPESVEVERSFEIAVAIKRQESTRLSEADLDRTESADMQIAWPQGIPFITLRVQVNAPECIIHGENSITFPLYRGQDSPIFYFQLTPRLSGRVGIVVTVYQEQSWLGGARLHTIAQEQLAARVQMTVHSRPVGDATEAQVSVAQKIEQHFNKTELHTLCYDLHVNYDNLRGETLAEKARELVGFMVRRGRFVDLLLECERQRPHVDWGEAAGIVPMGKD